MIWAPKKGTILLRLLIKVTQTFIFANRDFLQFAYYIFYTNVIIFQTAHISSSHTQMQIDPIVNLLAEETDLNLAV